MNRHLVIKKHKSIFRRLVRRYVRNFRVRQLGKLPKDQIKTLTDRTLNACNTSDDTVFESVLNLISLDLYPGNSLYDF